MSAITDFLLKMVLPTAEAALDAALDPILDDLHNSNLSDYTALVTSLHAGFSHLAPVVDKSKSDILKGIVSALEMEVNSNAAKYGITFDTVITAPVAAPSTETPSEPAQ